jgi:hypothetical protein
MRIILTDISSRRAADRTGCRHLLPDAALLLLSS